MTSPALDRTLLTQCPICLEQYTIPRALPCLHTFCEECLIDYVKTKNQPSLGLRLGKIRVFPCPVCKDDVTLPPNGVRGFKHNFYISTFAVNELHEQQHAGATSLPSSTIDVINTGVTCQRCEEAGVSRLCLKCAVWLCPLCCTDHSRVKATREHVLTSSQELADASVPSTVTSADLAVCEFEGHAGNTCQFFCVTCSVLICAHCHTSAHDCDAHEVLGVITNIDNIRKNLLEHLQLVQQRLTFCKSQERELNCYRKDMTRRYHTAQKTVFRTVDLLQRRMQDFKNHIYRELRKSLNSQMLAIDSHMKDLAVQSSTLEGVVEGVKNVLEVGSNRQLLTQADGLMEKGEAQLKVGVGVDRMLVKFPKVQQVDKIQMDRLLYEMIGTVSILTKEIEMTGRQKKTQVDRKLSSDDNSQSSACNTEPPAPPPKRGLAIPLILTQSCPSVDKLDSPTENSVCDVIGSTLGAAGASDRFPLSEGEDAIESRLPLPSPQLREHARVRAAESESQSTTCDDDSDDERSRCDPPPSGPFYTQLDSTEQADFWMPHSKQPPPVKRPPSPAWRRVQGGSPRRGRGSPSPSPNRTLERAVPLSPGKPNSRRVKPFIKKWKERQNSST